MGRPQGKDQGRAQLGRDSQRAIHLGRRRAQNTRKPCPNFDSKRTYPTELEALQQVYRNKRRDRTDIFYYQCDVCHRFHLTSQDPETIGMYWDGKNIVKPNKRRKR